MNSLQYLTSQVDNLISNTTLRPDSSRRSSRNLEADENDEESVSNSDNNDDTDSHFSPNPVSFEDELNFEDSIGSELGAEEEEVTLSSLSNEDLREPRDMVDSFSSQLRCKRKNTSSYNDNKDYDADVVGGDNGSTCNIGNNHFNGQGYISHMDFSDSLVKERPLAVRKRSQRPNHYDSTSTGVHDKERVSTLSSEEKDGKNKNKSSSVDTEANSKTETEDECNAEINSNLDMAARKNIGADNYGYDNYHSGEKSTLEKPHIVPDNNGSSLESIGSQSSSEDKGVTRFTSKYDSDLPNILSLGPTSSFLQKESGSSAPILALDAPISLTARRPSGSDNHSRRVGSRARRSTEEVMSSGNPQGRTNRQRTSSNASLRTSTGLSDRCDGGLPEIHEYSLSSHDQGLISEHRFITAILMIPRLLFYLITLSFLFPGKFASSPFGRSSVRPALNTSGTPATHSLSNSSATPPSTPRLISDGSSRSGSGSVKSAALGTPSARRSRMFYPPPPRPLLSQRYSRGHMKTLILDLDETLIHSLSRGSQHPAGHMVEVKLSKLHPSTLYYVHKRPYCDEFLHCMKQWFNLVVFTASVQQYADPVIDWLEQEQKFFSKRLYRQHCTLRPAGYTKDISTVESDLSRVVILDNSPISYAMHENNAIAIEGWINDPSDAHLMYLIPFMNALRFSMDVRSIITLKNGDIAFRD